MLFRFASGAALLAAASMAAAPLAAANLPRTATSGASSVLSTNGVNAENHRWHRRDRVDGGDIVAGVLVIGAIAAIAGAATKANRDREYRNPQRYPAPDQRYDYRSRATGSSYNDGRGLDRAVDMCAREIERNARIDFVDGVDRNGSGWRVSGRLSNGEPFTCSIGNDGRIDGVDYGRRGAENDRQWDNDRYAAARQSQDGAGMPAYPGGPIGNEPQDTDGRYDMAVTPDFEG